MDDAEARGTAPCMHQSLSFGTRISYEPRNGRGRRLVVVLLHQPIDRRSCVIRSILFVSFPLSAFRSLFPLYLISKRSAFAGPQACFEISCGQSTGLGAVSAG